MTEQLPPIANALVVERLTRLSPAIQLLIYVHPIGLERDWRIGIQLILSNDDRLERRDNRCVAARNEEIVEPVLDLNEVSLNR